MEKMKRRQQHAVCIPYPAQGHVTPLLKLAKLLHSTHNFHISFVNTDHNHRRLLRSRGPDAVAGLPSFRFHSIPDGLPPAANPDATQDVPSLCASISETGPDALRDLITRLSEESTPVTCVVADASMSFSVEVAEEFGLPAVRFWTASACALLGYAQYESLVQMGIVPLPEETTETANLLLELESQKTLTESEEKQGEVIVNGDSNKDSHQGEEEEEEEDQSSPRGVLDMPDSSDKSQCSLSSTNSLDRSSVLVHNKEKPFKGFIDAVRKSSVKKLALLASKKINRRKFARRIKSAEDPINIHCGLHLLPEETNRGSWRSFDFADLASATHHFSPENLIGKGGHAEVYKGCLEDGTIVAVKKVLSKEDEIEEERIGCFLSELGIIAHVEHPNAAKLIGFSVEKGLYLVLHYAPCGSLASHLHGHYSREVLKWEVRFRVALGVAEGLAYLHNKCQRRIIHRDIKASNILLSQDFQPMISDFGLAKWLPHKWTHHVVHPIEGTFGYLAPEYFMHGIVNEKTDVFAFGVVLLELLTGRHAVDSSRQSLVMWVKPHLESNNVKELIDPQLGEKYDPEELRRAMVTATMCIHHEPSCRPHMNRVVEVLRGEGGPMEMKQTTIHSRTILVDACDLDDYTCTDYLKDLSRHRELLME